MTNSHSAHPVPKVQDGCGQNTDPNKIMDAESVSKKLTPCSRTPSQNPLKMNIDRQGTTHYKIDHVIATASGKSMRKNLH